MLAPLYRVIKHDSALAPQETQGKRRDKATVTYIGRMASVAVTTATMVAVAGALLLGYFFMISTLTLFGLVLFIWDGVMLISTLTIATSIRHHRRQGVASTIPIRVGLRSSETARTDKRS